MRPYGGQELSLNSLAVSLAPSGMGALARNSTLVLVSICNIHERLLGLFFAHSHQPNPKFLIHFKTHFVSLEFAIIF